MSRILMTLKMVGTISLKGVNMSQEADLVMPWCILHLRTFKGTISACHDIEI